MSKKFPLATLGEVVISVKRSVVPVPGTTYRQIGVKLWGRGAYEREPMDGAQTKYRTLFRVEAGDIIVNKIWARNGSVAIVEESLAGCYGSSEFPIFAPIREKLDCRWLHWLTKTRSFWNQCDEKSRGTSGKNRIRPERFLEIKIPLPPLPEQRRIVAKIKELTAKIEEAKGLRRETIEETETLVDSALSQIFNQEKSCGLISSIRASGLEINRESRNPAIVNPNEDFLYLDISNVESKTGRILGVKRIQGYSAPSRARRVIKTNDVLFSTVRPYLKSLAIVTPFLDNEICSTGFAVFSCPKGINPKFLFYHFLSPFFIEQCEAKMRGGHYPAINDTNLKKLKLIIPDISEQNRIVTYLDNLQAKTDSLKRLQHETQSELDALIPSILAKAFKGEL